MKPRSSPVSLISLAASSFAAPIVVVEPPKPRNPVAPAARGRKAGAHSRTKKARRAQEQRELARLVYADLG